MYKQNLKFSQIKDKKIGMKNSGKINKTGFNAGGRYRSAPNRGRMNRNYGGSQQFNLQDVSKLKQLCTVTNEWIQQKSSELLDVLRRTDNKGGENCHRTVTVQSRMNNMNFGHKPPNIFNKSYEDNDFQRMSNSSQAPNFDHAHLGKSHPANMQYERNRNRSNHQERNWGVEPRDMAINPNSYQSKPKNHLFSVLEKLKIYVKDKPFSVYNGAKLLLDAVRATGTSYTLDYLHTDKDKPHRFDVVVENLILGSGKSFAKKKARSEAYANALNRLKLSSIAELCENVSSDKPEVMNKLSHQANIKHDDTRPISALVIIETQKTAPRREKQAMSILRRSVYFSKMDLSKQVSVVGNVHKVTILVQNKPVGIGFGSSVTKASANAAADALFNNFYRKNPVLLTRDEDDGNNWIHWSKVKYLAQEMQRIGGHSLIAGQDISNRSYATAIQKLVDTHPWNEIENELIFGPGMSDNCVKMLYAIAKERNLSFEERKHRQLGTYYIIQHYYDPIDIVRCLEKNGGSKGKYRLIPKSEILQIQCDHWEPKSQIWKQKKAPEEDPKSKSSSPKRQRESHHRMGETDRNFDNSSSQIGRAFNNGSFNSMSNKQKMTINDNQEFNVISQSKEKYPLPNNNEGRFDKKFTQDREMCGFNDRGFRQMSRSDDEFRPMSDSFDREPKQMSWPDDREFRQPNDREFGQMRQPDDRGFRQMPQTGDREFGQMQQSDDRGFEQMRQSDDRGFDQMRQSDNRGFDQIRQSDNRGFDQMRQSDNRGFDQMRQSDNRGFDQMRQSDNRGFDQMRQSDNRGFEQMRQSDNRGFDQMRQSDNRGFDQMHQSDNRGFDQMHQSDNRGFDQMHQSDNRGFEQMRQSDNRGFDQNHQSDNRGFDQMHQSDNRGFEQMRQSDNRGFEQMRQSDNQEFGQMRWPNKGELGQMNRPDDREFGQMSRTNYEESNQTNWRDRRGLEQTFWPQDNESNQMPGCSRDREFRETSRLDSGELRRMHNVEEQMHGLNERGMNDNFDREFSHNLNKLIGHDEKRFNSNYGYTGRDFNQMPIRNEREFNPLFSNDRERGHSYDENYKQGLNANRERFSQNPYENKLDKLSGQSDIGLHHSSNYDRRFNENIDFGKQLSDPDNRHYNQSLHQSKRDYDQVSSDDRLRQVTNYDDRRLRFNTEQVPHMDHQNNRRNPDDLINTKRMQNAVAWNKMQDQRGDGRIIAANPRMFPPNTQIPCRPPQENLMMQNRMNQEANKNQLTALTFLTKKIARTALHVNVKSILANARKLSNIAKARSQMEKSANTKAPFVRKRGKGNAANRLQKRTVPGNQPKTAPSLLRISQNSKVTKKSSGKQSALNKSTNIRVSSQSKNAKRMKISHSSSKGGNTTQKK